MENHYQLFGLTLKSELEFIELLPSQNDQPDIEIVMGDVPEELDRMVVKGVLFQAGQNQCLFRIRDVANYLVENGNRITVEIINDSEPGLIRAFLLGAVFGALLYQRGYLLLHGSAINSDKGAVVFCGASGVGKSTLAALMAEQGHQILTDYICAVYLDNDQNPTLLPAYPQLRLWSEALRKFSISTPEGRKQISERQLKFAVLKKNNFNPDPRLLRKIFILGTHNKDEFVLKHLQGMDKVRLLRRHIYLSRLESINHHKADRFNLLSEITNQTDVIHLARPQTGNRSKEICDLVKQELDR